MNEDRLKAGLERKPATPAGNPYNTRTPAVTEGGAMKWLRAILVGVIAAEAVLFAAAGPRWRRPFDPDGRLLPFSGDGRTVFGLGDAHPDPPTLHVWDADTGTTRAVVLTAAARNDRDRYAAAVAPDGRTVLLWNRGYAFDAPAPEHPDAVTYRCRLFDTTTGGCVGEPFTSSPLHEIAWSADGRWFLERRPDPDGGAVRVRAAPGGELVAEIAGRLGESLDAFAVNPAGVTLLWWCDGPADGGRYAVETARLLAGRVSRRCELPACSHSWALVPEPGRVVVRHLG